MTDPKIALAKIIFDAIKNNTDIDSASILDSEKHVIGIEFRGEDFFVEVIDVV